MTTYRLIDGLDGTPWENTFHCSCGERLWPDCDMSSVSVRETWEQHLASAHGIGHVTEDETPSRKERPEWAVKLYRILDFLSSAGTRGWGK